MAPSQNSTFLPNQRNTLKRSSGVLGQRVSHTPPHTENELSKFPNPPLSTIIIVSVWRAAVCLSVEEAMSPDNCSPFQINLLVVWYDLKMWCLYRRRQEIKGSPVYNLHICREQTSTLMQK